MLSLIPPLASTTEIKPLQMPVIDFSMLHRANDRSSVVVNHGISKSVMKGALEAASEFFEMPAESKAEFTSSDVSKPVRYDCSNDGINKRRSFLKHYAHPLDEWIQFWPAEPPSLF